MKGQTNSFVLDNRLQRALRHNMTEAEKALWQRLRGKQLSGYKFRRQHPFGDFVIACAVCAMVGAVVSGMKNRFGCG
jgi:very-short-patch-repair endonuclease